MSLDQAVQNVQAYVTQMGNADLAVDEVMEFTQNYYAIVKERSTGLGAFEVLVNKANGGVLPELGPNMMWNTKYGHMADWGCGTGAGAAAVPSPSVTADQARQVAQQWLDQYQAGSATEEPDAFYGYYTVHTLRDGQVSGMLSVNAYTGQVWYHTWHGAFIGRKELEQ
ncbi:MAG: PepSY domain-containing protein [Chloroflexi bacterium]|nr:PepSY domain-containing protein [Chloroflexota bacterium]